MKQSLINRDWPAWLEGYERGCEGRLGLFVLGVITGVLMAGLLS